MLWPSRVHTRWKNVRRRSLVIRDAYLRIERSLPNLFHAMKHLLSFMCIYKHNFNIKLTLAPNTRRLKSHRRVSGISTESSTLLLPWFLWVFECYCVKRCRCSYCYLEVPFCDTLSGWMTLMLLAEALGRRLGKCERLLMIQLSA